MTFEDLEAALIKVQVLRYYATSIRSYTLSEDRAVSSGPSSLRGPCLGLIEMKENSWIINLTSN